MFLFNEMSRSPVQSMFPIFVGFFGGQEHIFLKLQKNKSTSNLKHPCSFMLLQTSSASNQPYTV